MRLNVAFIPIRAGSKSIPLKNIRPMAGKPLALWSMEAALNCALIDKVVVSTDSDLVVEHLMQQHPKLEFFKRSPEFATDTASTESAMLEYFETRSCDTICLMQATSPLVTSEDLTKGYQLLENYDSVLSGVRQKRFIWEQNDSVFRPVNYEIKNRPRRQDFKGFLVENGAFYISKFADFIQSKNRLSGKIGFVEMPEDTYLELDEPSDWDVIQNILLLRQKRNLPDLKKIKLFAFDVDGVLTDGGMYYGENGNELKKFNTRDGKGIELIRGMGIKTAVITSENKQLNLRRFEKLKVNHIIQNEHSKLEAVKRICLEEKIELSEVSYIGDDINDLDLLRQVGFSASPVDGISEVKNIVNYICKTEGGGGCVRELAELILGCYHE